jgi:putative photosynthetic complex assembly protein
MSKVPMTAKPFPRGALIGAAALIGLTIILAGTARLSGIGALYTPDPDPVAQRDLRFVDRADGAVVVYEAPSGDLVEVLEPGTNGFLRGALRGLARERKRQAIAAEPPFRLMRGADGTLTLADPTTGRQIWLAAFGPTNAAAFARLMPAAEATP